MDLRGECATMQLVRVATALVAITCGAAAFVPLRGVNASPEAHQHVHSPAVGTASALLGAPQPFAPGRRAGRLFGPRATLHSADGRVATSAARARLFRTGHQGGEATLGVTSAGSIFFVGATMDQFPRVAMKVVRSKDGGRTWDVVWPTAADEITKYAYPIDPYLYVDPATDAVFATGLPVGCALLAYSRDDGDSWSSDRPICGPMDHETIFAGPPVTSKTTGYPRILYYCANAGLHIPWSNTCSKSTDGGQTFLPTGDPAFPSRGADDPLSCIGPHGHGVAGSDGKIYLPRVWCGGEPYVAISGDEGLSWDQVQVAAEHESVGAAMEPGPANLPPAPVHDASVAVDDQQNIYVTWAGRNRLPYLSISRDGGKTWTRPVAVGPPGVNEAWYPQIDVGAPGEIAISYLGTEESPGQPFEAADYEDVTWHGFITRSADALSANPVFVTARVNPLEDPLMRGPCGPTRCQAQWDYQDVVIDSRGAAWAIFMDQCYEGTCDHVAGGGAVPYGEAVIARFEFGARGR